jgi:hypothetical protein
MKKCYLVVLVLLSLSQIGMSQVSYSLSVQDQHVSGSDFIFDVYLRSTGDPLYLAQSDIKLDFNEEYFSSPGVSPSWGSALSWYTKAVVIDGAHRIVISIGALFYSDDAEFDTHVALISTSVPGTKIGTFTVSTISQPSGTAGLAWYYSGTAGTDIWNYYETDPPYGTSRVTSYSNVDPPECSLPVQMSNMEGESTVDGIELRWETASEVGSAGFHVWRSDAVDGSYERITTSLIPGQGNNSSGAVYNFTDKNYEGDATYYYRIEQVDADGGSEMFSAIEVTALFIPTEYALSQNYPNPFNPMTTFTYDVPEVSDVTIRVYSLLGKEVRTLYSKQQMPGRYTEVWDGTDNTGRKLASGVYFLRMQAGSYSKLRKMTLIR